MRRPKFIKNLVNRHRDDLKNTIINDIDQWIYKLIVDNETIIECDENVSMYINPSDFVVSRRIWREGEFQPRIRDYVNKNLDKGDVAIDVGANIGYFTVIMGKAVEHTGMVYAFEPNEENRQILKKNVQENELDEIVVVRSEAVSDQNGSAELSIADINKGSHSIIKSKKPQNVVEVPTVKIDNVINDKIDLIKVDVEGAEDKVVAGMEQILSKYAPTVILEYNPKLWDRDIRDTFGPLSDAGLSPYELQQGGEVKKKTINDILQKTFSGDIVFKP
jgi:FkbM family methyltransferase